ncbi:MAG: hypothetical protein WC482_04595, partial [Candidatus Omnitrophota bacterium]
MIEYQINPTKRLMLKIVAVLLIATFTWYDISWASDLFYNNLGYTSQTAPTADLNKAREVTNYDQLSYGGKDSSRKLLPSGSESEQSQKFAPSYIQEQQSKHEEIIRQKQDTQSMISSLDDKLKSKTGKQEEEALPLKKKRGGGGDGNKMSSEPITYTLSDYDEDGNAQQINVYTYNSDGSINSITSYDITGLDASKWTSAGKEMTDKEGNKFFGSTSEADKTGLTEDRILDSVMYSGELVDYVLSGYGEDGKPTIVSVYDYTKDGEGSQNLDEVRTYDVEDTDIDLSKSKKDWISLLTEDNLSKTAVYEGEKDKERIKYVLDNYSVSDSGQNDPTTIGVYDYNNNQSDDAENETLDEVRSYDISDYYGTKEWDEVLSELLSDSESALEKYKNGLEELSVFSGAKGSETIQQTYYYSDGEIVKRSDYEYAEYEAKYSESKKTALRNIYTYETDGLGSEADRKVRGAGELVGESAFTGAAGRENIDQSFTYYDGQVIDRRDFVYENGKLVSDILYDTEGMSEEEARQRGAGIEDELRTYAGSRDHEKVAWSSTYGDISAGEIALVDPNSTQFRDTLKDLFVQGEATINGVSYVKSMTEDQVNSLVYGALASVAIAGENRIYTYTHPTSGDYTMMVSETVNGAERSVYRYTGIAGKEILSLSSNSVSTSAYTYENGILKSVKQFKDANNNGAYDEGDTLRSQITYSGAEGDERISTIIKYANNLIKTNSTYQYNLDAASGGDDDDNTLDKVVEYYGSTQVDKKTEYLYYKAGITNIPQREKILESISYRTDGTKESSSTYEYDLSVIAGGDGASKTLDKVTTYGNTNRDWSGTTYKKTESFYEGRESKEKIAQMVKYDAEGEAIERTEYNYGNDVGTTQDDGLDMATTYKLSKGVNGEEIATVKSETIYAGYEGEEIANYTKSYNSSGTSVVTTTFYRYDGLYATDPAVISDDAMDVSETYKGEFNVPTEGFLQSKTYYVGEKGDEIADYSNNYKLGTDIIKSTSKFYYGTTKVEAASADPEDAMTMSSTYKGDSLLATTLQSKTYYVGEK